MTDEETTAPDTPVLTDIVEDSSSADVPADEDPSAGETLIAELQTKLSVGAFTLTEQLLHSAISEMEATLFEQMLNRLRQELPELIDSVLREHLGTENNDD